MNAAEREIAKLDLAIRHKGETVKLQRTIGTSPNQSTFSAEMRAWVRPYGSKELIGGITQGDFLVVLSPTGVLATQWPGGQSPAQVVPGDVHVPRTTDKIVVQGRTRQIVSVLPRKIGDTVCRIDCQVRG